MMVAYRIRGKAERQGFRKGRKRGSTRLPGSWRFQGITFGTRLCQLLSAMPMSLTDTQILGTESVRPGLAHAWPLEKEGQDILISRLIERISDEEGWVQQLSQSTFILTGGT